MKKGLMLLVLLGVVGCTNKEIYDSFQNVQPSPQNYCINNFPNTYEECMERRNQSYEEYDREREAISK